MNPAEILLLKDEERTSLFNHTAAIIEQYIKNSSQMPVSPPLDKEEIRRGLDKIDFSKPLSPIETAEFVSGNLTRYQVHISHPSYFGLFNPAPSAMGIAADFLAGAFNPQLAAWSHSPFACEVENFLIRQFAVKFGIDANKADGTFTSGGAEANHTAIVCALVKKYPAFARSGIRGLESQPVMYVSEQSHHSFIKAARLCGLGTDSVHIIPVDSSFRMDTVRLSEEISKDRAKGLSPFFVAATAGSTNAGIIDRLEETASVAASESLWFHIDAAWGGAAVFVPALQYLLSAAIKADSITFDAHKWLSVPMGAGIFITKNKDILNQTFRISADYMPKDAEGMDIIDPFSHSMQWSRRFIGLKVFMTLCQAGWTGYETVIRHQVEMGYLLKEELKKSGWTLVNDTPLPVACFTDNSISPETRETFNQNVAREVISSGMAWISTTRLSDTTPVIRACITNYKTTPKEVKALVDVLGKARSRHSPNL